MCSFILKVKPKTIDGNMMFCAEKNNISYKLHAT